MDFWLEQNGRYFAGDIFKNILMHDAICVSISMKSVTKGAFDNKSSPVDSPHKGPVMCRVYSMPGHHHVHIHVVIWILRLNLSTPFDDTLLWCTRGAKQIALSHWDSRHHNAEWRGELTGQQRPIVISNKPLFDALVPKLMNYQNLVLPGWCLESTRMKSHWAISTNIFKW